MSAKQGINDKLQGSVATYLRYGGVVTNQIKVVYYWVIAEETRSSAIAEWPRDASCQ